MPEPDGIYSVSRQIRFGDSDPAGIVFYVAFFRMFNDVFESWIGDRLGIDFAREFFDQGRMFPLVHCDVDFKKPRRMGDNLDLALILTAIGRSSIRYAIVGSDRGEEILRGDFVTCVASKAMGRSIPIPDYLRRPMTEYLELCRRLGAAGA